MLQPFEPILAIDRSYSTCFRSLKVSNDIGCLIRVLNLLLSFSSLSGSKAAAEFFSFNENRWTRNIICSGLSKVCFSMFYTLLSTLSSV